MIEPIKVSEKFKGAVSGRQRGSRLTCHRDSLVHPENLYHYKKWFFFAKFFVPVPD